jgi:hypothetical protein
MANIGVEDRNFIMGLGSMVIFLVSFGLSVLVMYACLPCKNSFGIRTIYNLFTISGYLRVIWIRFLLETFIDLFLLCLINFENFYLFDVPSNWGPNGNISMSDQLSIILGIFFTIWVILFPFFIW